MRVFRCDDCEMVFDECVATIEGCCHCYPDGSDEIIEWETSALGCPICGAEDSRFNSVIKVIDIDCTVEEYNEAVVNKKD